MTKVGIVGATGYTGAELLRLLARHPDAEINVVTSRSESGKPVHELFPALRGFLDQHFADPQTDALADCDVVFFAAPNGTAMQQVPALLDGGVRVIDLSADFRLKNADVWSHWYGQEHAAPGLLDKAVYGLPELYRDAISKADLVANPGCYPTAVLLGLLPLLEEEVIDPSSIIADAKSGISGAGRKSSINLLLAENAESFRAYAVEGHRHLPEITQILNSISVSPVSLTFVPHLLPMIRGIHATIYARIDKAADLQSLFEQRYKDEIFVDVMPLGTHPETRSVRGSNFCRLAVHRPGNGNNVVVLSVIDNLVKGAAGQAIQNMNLMFGLAENTGLQVPAMMP